MESAFGGTCRHFLLPIVCQRLGQQRKLTRAWRAFVTVFMFLAFARTSHAQEGFFSSWEDRVRATVAEQPSWPVPVVTPSSGLVQLFRTDFVRQISPVETTTWNYGNTKGIDIIPWYKTELDIAAPPYIHHNSTVKDGFGDLSMLLKYRVISANEK